jgi:hypothetical protein
MSSLPEPLTNRLSPFFTFHPTLYFLVVPGEEKQETSRNGARFGCPGKQDASSPCMHCAKADK